jgi:GrpB-like predicted nucleotidyltransferase (UPF0157 family)
VTSADPPWAYEKTAVHPPDLAWADRGQRECARLAALLAPWLADGVEHVGSTSVPGLAAKPVLDIMASVTDPEAVTEHASARLAADGWHYVPPELDSGGAWRRFFVKPDAAGQRRVAHLHVIAAGHPRWADQLAFRDALRRDGRLAAEYAELKRRLTQEHGADREAYTAAKGEFVAAALGRGRPSRARRARALSR